MTMLQPILRTLALATLLLAACGDDDASPGTPDAGGNPLDIPVDPVSGLRIAAIPPVPALPDWPDNPPTEAKKKLGRAIFGDFRLSGSGTAVCSNCHLSTTHFQSSTQLDVPDRVFPSAGPTLHRHTPSLYNIVYAPVVRWDGSHFTNLADMMVLPFAEANMNLSGLPASAGLETIDLEGAQAALKKKLTVDIPGYVAWFQDAFGEDISQATPERIWRLTGLALAVYIRVAVSRDSAFDSWNAGDDAAISDGAKRGALLFTGKAGCINCHYGPLLSDYGFHNISTSLPAASGQRPDDGRFLVTGVEADRGAFLTPSLRSAGRSSPYFHDGAVVGIAQAVRHKSSAAGRQDPLHDPVLDTIPDLTEAEIDDVVQFVKSLDGAPLPPADTAPPTVFP